MIVKFMGNKGGGSIKATFDYLQSKEKDKFRVLSGSPNLTQNLVDSLNFKNKYTVGVLSFEESEISEKTKYEIMERFENTIFNGLEKDQYNITWIEHTDKNRVELNFVIANVELHTGKRLQPYYDKADRPLVENFKQVINYEYKLSDPNDPSKKQLSNTLNVNNLPKKTKEIKSKIDNVIQELIVNNEVKDQKDVVKFLEKSGFTIARVTDKSISIENPEPNSKNIRLKGLMYENRQFSNELGKQQERDVAEYERTKSDTYKTATRRLETALNKRAEFNKRTYQRNDQIYQNAIVTRDDTGINNRDMSSLFISSVDDIQRTSRSISNTEYDIERTSQRQEVSKIMGETENIRTRQQTITGSTENRQQDMGNNKGRASIGNKLIEKVQEYADRFTDFSKGIIERIRTRKSAFSDTEQEIDYNNKRAESRNNNINETEQHIERTEQHIARAEQDTNKQVREINNHIQFIEEKIRDVEPRVERGWSMER